MSRGVAVNLMLSLAALACSAAVAEIVLRLNGSFDTYPEKNGRGYVSPYYSDVTSPYIASRGIQDRSTHANSEFSYEIMTNREGVRDVEHMLEKKPDTYRIVLLGDSFAEGIGVEFSDSPVARLQSSLRQKGCGKEIEVIGGGVSGTDPVQQLELLNRRLMKYHPDMVVLLVNNTDVEDLIARGGAERFDSNGYVQWEKKTPRIEPLFQHSHLFRAFAFKVLKLDWMLLTSVERSAKAETAILRLNETFLLFSKFAAKSGFKLLIAIHPLRESIAMPDSWPLILNTISFLKNNSIPHANLIPLFRSKIKPGEVGDYMWPVDGHFKPNGYRILADGIEAELRSIDGFPLCSKN